METTSTPPATTTPETPAVETPSLINAAPKAEPAVAEPFVPLTAEAFTLPEGYSVDPESMTSFLGIVNNRELSPQAMAQSLLELQANLSTKSSEAGSQAWAETQQNWQAEVAADPVIGGPNLEKTLTGINGLLDRFGNADVRSAFDQTGAGNNPHIIRFIATLVDQLGEAKVAPLGSPTAQVQAPGLTSIYDHPTSKAGVS